MYTKGLYISYVLCMYILIMTYRSLLDEVYRMSEYEKQALNFLNKTNTIFKAVYGEISKVIDEETNQEILWNGVTEDET